MLLEKAAAYHARIVEANGSAATVRGYANIYHQFGAHLSEALGRAPALADVTLDAAVGWQVALRRSGVQRSTVAHYTILLHKWIRDLVNDIPDAFPAGDPLAGIRKPRAEKTVPSVLRGDQVQALVAFAGMTTMPLRDAAIVQLLADSGIRNNELCNLQRKDVELASKARSGRVKILSGKGDRDRWVGIGVETSKALSKYLELARKKDDAPWLFTTRYGVQITTGVVRNIVRAIGRKAGIKSQRVHPHAFRHTFGTQQAKAGKNASAIQHQLGHSDLRTTQRYIDLSQMDLADTYTSLMDTWKRDLPRGKPDPEELR